MTREFASRVFANLHQILISTHAASVSRPLLGRYSRASGEGEMQSLCEQIDEADLSPWLPTQPKPSELAHYKKRYQTTLVAENAKRRKKKKKESLLMCES